MNGGLNRQTHWLIGGVNIPISLLKYQMKVSLCIEFSVNLVIQR